MAKKSVLTNLVGSAASKGGKNETIYWGDKKNIEAQDYKVSKREQEILELIKANGLIKNDIEDLIKIVSICRDYEIPIAQVKGILKDYLTGMAENAKNEYNQLIRVLWDEKQENDFLEEKHKKIKKLFEGSRGIYYSIGVFLAELSLINNNLEQSSIRRISRTRNGLIDEMSLIGNYDENGVFVVREDVNNGFTFDAFIKFNGIEDERLNTIKDYNNLIEKINSLIETQRKCRDDKEKDSYEFYNRLFSKTIPCVKKFIDAFPDECEEFAFDSNRLVSIIELSKEIKTAFSECGIEFVFSGNGTIDYFTRENALNRAAVYNASKGIILQRGNISIEV